MWARARAHWNPRLDPAPSTAQPRSCDDFVTAFGFGRDVGPTRARCLGLPEAQAVWARPTAAARWRFSTGGASAAHGEGHRGACEASCSARRAQRFCSGRRHNAHEQSCQRARHRAARTSQGPSPCGRGFEPPRWVCYSTAAPDAARKQRGAHPVHRAQFTQRKRAATWRPLPPHPTLARLRCLSGEPGCVS